MTDSWRTALPPEECEIYSSAGFGHRDELSNNVAVVIIDVTYGFTGHRGMSGDQSRAQYPNSCGPSAWPAVQAIARLAAAARSNCKPVIYSRDLSGDDRDGVWKRKHGRLSKRPADDSQIVADIEAQPGDEVILKSAPSIFFESDLATRLRSRGVKDLLIAGTSTSGCVRASVVDAFSHGFGVAVVEEAVFDRAHTSHNVSLFEMDQKYGNVINLDDAIGLLLMTK
jgi:maleamate amidohydrolase